MCSVIAGLHMHASPLYRPHGSSIGAASHAVSTRFSWYCAYGTVQQLTVVLCVYALYCFVQVALLLQELRSGSSSSSNGKSSTAVPITSLPQLQAQWVVSDSFLKANCALWVKKGHEALFNSMWSRMTGNAKQRAHSFNTLNNE
jgi:hypothetical protein